MIGSGGDTGRTLLLVEDDCRVRTVAAALLRAEGYAVVEAGSRAAAERAARAQAPTVAVVDLGLPDGSGLEVVRLVLALHPAARVLVLSVADAPAAVLASLAAGAVGYLLKEELVTRLPFAVEECARGGVAFSPGIARIVLERVRPPVDPGPCPVASALTPAELRVLGGLARGLSYAEVGLLLDVTANTVRSHVRAIYGKLEVSTKTEAVVTALSRGLISEV